MPSTTHHVAQSTTFSLLIALALAGCARPDKGTPSPSSAAASDSTTPSAPDPAADTPPGLNVGDRVPDATLLTSTGAPVQLASLYAQRPVVVTFYRGGWCPYCNRALTQWQSRLAELEAQGVDLVAITPERPEATVETAGNAHADFTILSDASFQAADAFRVRFSLDESTQRRYKGYGVDLESHNAAGLWDLPAPATFLIDTAGVVRYAWANWDYTKRADPSDVIAAARALRSTGTSGTR